MSMSTNALTEMLSGQILTQQNNISNLEGQLSSGLALNKPSDNPVAVTQVLSLSNQASQISSWQANINTAQSWLGTASGTLNNVISAMQSARTLLLQAANQGTQDTTSYKAIGQQLMSISNNMLALANTQYEGRSLFAGTSASQQAYDSSGNYLGNSDTPTVIVGPGAGSGQAIDLSVTGPAVFGSGSSNIFTTLSNVASALSSGTPTSSQISGALTALDNNLAIGEQASATIGNSALEVSNMASALTQQLTSIQNSQAQLQNINIPLATTQLNNEITNYQAALWAASRAIPETLQQFIAP
jgi:flagellar hook-associated protein 3 FlgL